MISARIFASASLIAIPAALGATTFAPSAAYADSLLAGAITSASGEKMGGVTVSAKAEGATITTTVFTDEAGDYYFPPLAAGNITVWAQALSFETAKSDVDLDKQRRARISRSAADHGNRGL